MITDWDRQPLTMSRYYDADDLLRRILKTRSKSTKLPPGLPRYIPVPMTDEHIKRVRRGVMLDRLKAQA